MRRKWALLGVVTFVTLAATSAAVFAFIHSREPSRHAHAHAHAAPSRASTPALLPIAGDFAPIRPARDAWQAGQRRLYAAEFGTNFRNAATPDADVSIVGTGKLELTAAESEPERLLLEVRLLSPSVILDHQAHQDESIESTLAADLEHALVVSVLPNGRIEYVSTPPELGSFPRTLLCQIVATMQFVQPEGDSPNLRQWSTTEADQNGTYEARYHAVDSNSHVKTKVKYTFLQMAKALGLPQDRMNQRIGTEVLFTFDRKGILTSVRGHEAMELSVGDKPMKVESYVRLTLEKTERVRVQPPAGQLRREALFEIPPVSVPENEAARREKLVAGADLAELLKETTALTIGNESAEQRWSIIERLSALFALRPEEIRAASDKLKGPIGTVERQVLLAALSETGTPEASRALSELARDVGTPSETRQAALSQVGFVSEPDAAIFQDLQSVASTDPDPSMRKTATLAMGGAALKAASASVPPAEAAESVRYLSRMALSGASPAERRLALLALGNSGSVEALGVVRTCLADPDPFVRASALEALRLVEDPRADALLAETLLRDSVPSVRIAACNIANERPYQPSLAESWGTALRIDPEAEVRIAVIQLVASKRSEQPDLQRLLDWVMANDPVDRVKLAAQEVTKPPRRGS